MEPNNFPSNSKREREKETEKTIEKVVSGEVKRRKKPLGKRLAETFIAGEAKGVGSYVIFDVLVPAVKDVFADVVSQGIERMLFGEARSASRRTGYRPGGSSGYVNYNRQPTSSPWSRQRPDDRPNISRRARTQHDFDEIVLATRAEANQVLDSMFNLIQKYEQVTIADLYALVDITASFTDEKWGWTDFRGAGVTRISSGYLLDLPKPEPLD